MADIAHLGYKIDSKDAATAEKRLKAMERAAHSVGSRAGRLIGHFTGLAGAAKLLTAGLAGLSVGGLALVVNRQRQIIDQNAKLAQSIGATVGGMQAMERAAGRAGVEHAELNSAVQRFNQSLGMAIERGGNQKKVLDALGLSAERLSQMDVDERFVAVSKRMKEMNLSTQQSSAFLRELGIRQSSMIVLLRDGGTEIEASREKLERYGVTLNDIDASKVEMANDAIGELEIIATGAGNALTIAMAPILKQIAEDLGLAAERAGGVNTAVQEMVDDGVRVVAFLANAVDGLGRAFTVVGNVIVTSLSGSLAVAAVKAGDFLSILDKIPGVDLASASESAKNFARDQSLIAQQATKDITEAINAPLAGDRMKRYVAAARERAQADAEAAVSTRTATGEIVRAMQDQAEAAEKATDKVKERVQALQEEAAVLGLTRRETELYKLAAMGATGEMLKMADAALKQVEAFDKVQASRDNLSSIEESLRTEEEALRISYVRRRNMILEYTERTGVERNDLLRRLDEEFNAQMAERNQTFWDTWISAAQQNLANMDTLVGDLFSNMASQSGQLFESIILDSESAGEAVDNLFNGMARMAVNALGQMAMQWLQLNLVEKATRKSAASTAATSISLEAQLASQRAALNAYASTAAIPVTGPALAPAAAATALAATAPMAATVSALAAGMAGVAHSGIDEVPREGTWLLDRGERVVDSSTNRDLKQFLAMPQQMAPPVVNVSIEKGAQEDSVESTPGPDGSLNLKVMVKDAVNGLMGEGAFDRSMGQRFGVRNRGISRG